jgi:hypothetical protein
MLVLRRINLDCVEITAEEALKPRDYDGSSRGAVADGDVAGLSHHLCICRSGTAADDGYRRGTLVENQG